MAGIVFSRETFHTHLAVIGLLGLTSPLLVFWCGLIGLYRTGNLRPIPSSLSVTSFLLRGGAPTLVCALGIGLLINPRVGLIVLSSSLLVVGAAAVAVLLGRLVAVRLLPNVVGGHEKVLIVGSGETAEAIAFRFSKKGSDVVGMIDDDPLPGFPTIGSIENIYDICKQSEISCIVIAHPRAPWLKVSELIAPLIGAIDIYLIPSLHELMSWRSGTMDLAGMPLIPIVGAQSAPSARHGKRVMDIFGAAALLLLCTPILLFAIVGLLLDDRAPVFFRQERAGRNGEVFRIWKFRTMVCDAEMRKSSLRPDDGSPHLFKMKVDPRVTKFGNVLRRYSIDELPQLFNVLTGQMSLVGPRPYPLDESNALQTGSAASRFEMLPGMTGLWQVSGRSDLTWDELCRLDAIYVRSWSLLWDLRILLQTPAAVLRGDGAY